MGNLKIDRKTKDRSTKVFELHWANRFDEKEGKQLELVLESESQLANQKVINIVILVCSMLTNG